MPAATSPPSAERTEELILIPRSNCPQVRSADVVALDDALTDLSNLDEQQGRIVALSSFGGLVTEEIAEVLGISASTVKRDWNVAKAWLTRHMKKGSRGEDRAVGKN